MKKRLDYKTNFEITSEKIKKDYSRIMDLYYKKIHRANGLKFSIPVPVIKQVLDHSDVKTTMRHVHTEDQHVNEHLV